MRLPVPGPRDVMSLLERGGDQLEAVLGAVPRVLALLEEEFHLRLSPFRVSRKAFASVDAILALAAGSPPA